MAEPQQTMPEELQNQPAASEATNVEDPSETVEVEPAEVVQATPSRPLKASQRRRSKAEMSKRPDWLPPDWRVELTRRRRGKTAGTYDPHYFSPSGVKYRSKVAVEEAIKRESESGNPSATFSGENTNSANEPKRQRTEGEEENTEDASSKEVS